MWLLLSSLMLLFRMLKIEFNACSRKRKRDVDDDDEGHIVTLIALFNDIIYSSWWFTYHRYCMLKTIAMGCEYFMAVQRNSTRAWLHVAVTTFSALWHGYIYHRLTHRVDGSQIWKLSDRSQRKSHMWRLLNSHYSMVICCTLNIYVIYYDRRQPK